MRWIVLVLAALASTSAQAAEIEFVRRATEVELAAASRDTPDLFQAAAQARLPVDVWAGTSGHLTALRMASQAFCASMLDGRPVGAMGACPVIIYQDLGTPPIRRGVGGEALKWPIK